MAGCGSGPARFCPQEPVTRGQLAAALVGAFGLGPAASVGYVDTGGNVHEHAIDALAATGAVGPCATDPLRYCPDRTVTRGQAARVPARLIRHHQPPGPQGVRKSGDLPDVGLVAAGSSERVALGSVVDGSRLTLLWFMSPW